jgi:hypothetical protein
MSEMIKRVARAICCESGVCENSSATYDPARGSVSICASPSFEMAARAAIKAMREPTFGMRVRAVEAGVKAARPLIERCARNFDELEIAITITGNGRIYDAAWAAMIEDALK